MKFKKHVFVCTNERPNGKESCGEIAGMDLVREFQQQLALQGLRADVRAQKSGCLDVCTFGPALVVYPDGVFYGKVSKEDVAEIVTKHIGKNEVVERLKLTFNK
jgi:(2Fe-2S) ferredoxin